MSTNVVNHLFTHTERKCGKENSRQEYRLIQNPYSKYFGYLKVLQGYVLPVCTTYEFKSCDESIESFFDLGIRRSQAEYVRQIKKGLQTKERVEVLICFHFFFLS